MSPSYPAGQNRSRRGFLTLIGATGAAALVGLQRAAPALAQATAAPANPPASGQPLPHLTTDDPIAKALHYVEDAAKADKASAPTYKAGDKCSNCQLYQGSAGQQYGPCTLFPGKSVNANGWCASHTPKV